MHSIIAQLNTQPEAPVLIDVRTESGSPDFDIPAFKQKARLLAIALPGQDPWLIDVRNAGQRIAPLIGYLETRKLVGHNLQTKLGILSHQYGFKPQQGNAACVMAASQILFMGYFATDEERKPNIHRCYQRAFQQPLGSAEALSWTGELTKVHQQQIRQELEVLPALYDSCIKAIATANLDAIWHLEMSIIPQLIEMQMAGMGIHYERLHFQLEEANREKAETEIFLNKHVGKLFNPDNNKDTRDLLKRLGFAVPNLKFQTLAKLDHPVAKAIYRFKLSSQNLWNLVAINGSIGLDGRAHCILDPLWAETGRVVTRNFNLQGIRKVSPGTPDQALPQEIRACFRADPGKTYFVADFKGEELRILAYYTEEPNLIDALRRGEDLHDNTAATVLHKKLPDISESDHALGKELNFGFVYGQGAKGLAEKLGIPEQQAQLMIESFFDKNKFIKARKNACWAMARGDVSEVRTNLGRLRWVPSTGTPREDRKSGVQSEWDRFTALFHGPIQGTGADGLKITLDSLHGQLPAGSRLIAVAHDSFMGECINEKGAAMETIQRVESAMRESMDILCPGIPFEVETEVGSNWAQMASFEGFEREPEVDQ